jgi:MFS family permease
VLSFVRNAPPPGQTKTPPGKSWQIVWQGVSSAIILPDVWKIAIVAACLSGPMLSLGGLWGTPYLMESYGLERPNAAFLMSFILLGWAVGAPISGMVSDRLGRRKIVLVCASLGVVFGVAMLIFFPQLPLWFLVCVITLIGFSGGGMAATYALVQEIMPSHLGAASTGIVNSMTVASGALLQPLVGMLLDMMWDGNISAGVRLYDAGDYRLAFLCILGSAVIGLIAALSLSEVPVAQRKK